MMCEELKLACTVQMRRFETLVPALNANQGDAAIASIATTPEMRAKVDFTDPYYRTPARFVAQARFRRSTTRCPSGSKARRSRWSPAPRTRPISRRCSPRPRCGAYPSADVARLALRRGDVDLLFGDAISLAFWLNGTDSENCCAFRGGPYMDSRYFGEGIGIAVEEATTRQAGAQLGAVPGVGAGPFHRSVAAVFPDQPVLTLRLRDSARRMSMSEPMLQEPAPPRCANSPSIRTPGRSRRRARSSRGSRRSPRTR